MHNTKAVPSVYSVLNTLELIYLRCTAHYLLLCVLSLLVPTFLVQQLRGEFVVFVALRPTLLFCILLNEVRRAEAEHYV